MKSITYQKSRPKLPKDIANRKQTQTRSTLNSGRSSTNNNNKRHSHQFTYQTELLKNLNKSTNLHLNLNSSQVPSSISHKVISENTQFNTKKTQPKTKKHYQKHMAMKNFTKQTISKHPSREKHKNAEDATDMHKFHSHRQSLVINRQNIVNQKANSQQKENICPNSISQSKKFHQQTNKPSLGKLNFILEKDFKQKTNLTKKKLLLSNQYSINNKQNLYNKKQQKYIKDKEKSYTLLNSNKQDEIRSTSNSIKQSKKSIGSGRNQTIQKKKQTLRYINNNDSQQLVSSQIDPCHLLRQNQQKYLKLKSPSEQLNYETNTDDRTFSIKSLLKALIDSESSGENQQHKNIRKIIDCLTTNDNQTVEEDRSEKLFVGRKNSVKGERIKEREESFKLKEKISSQIQSNQQSVPKISKHINNDFLITQAHNKKDIPSIHYSNSFIKSQPHVSCNQCHSTQQNDSQQMHTINGYEMKIMQLYEELIEEKEKTYKLQQIIQKYIMSKQHQSIRY